MLFAFMRNLTALSHSILTYQFESSFTSLPQYLMSSDLIVLTVLSILIESDSHSLSVESHLQLEVRI